MKVTLTSGSLATTLAFGTEIMDLETLKFPDPGWEFNLGPNFLSKVTRPTEPMRWLL